MKFTRKQIVISLHSYWLLDVSQSFILRLKKNLLWKQHMAIYSRMNPLSGQFVCNDKGGAFTNDFCSKTDSFFVKIILIAILIIGVATFLPLFAGGWR